jgi:hypothetical protein
LRHVDGCAAASERFDHTAKVVESAGLDEGGDGSEEAGEEREYLEAHGGGEVKKEKGAAQRATQEASGPA